MNPTQLERDASIIAPPARLKVSEWAEREAWIPGEGNAEPGKFRLARMPHQAAMLDDPIDPEVRETYHMIASQLGKTLCLIFFCEYVISVLRKSIIMARATKETATEWMRDKFLPTVEATPCMAGLLPEPRKRGSNSTSLNRKFPGGGLKCIGAKSPAAFRGSSAGVLLGDELDSWENGKEGDPEALFDRAAITFGPEAMVTKCSTPTLAETSRINKGCLRGDQQKYFLPCHHCGKFQDLDEERHLKFSFTAEELARFNHGDTETLRNEKNDKSDDKTKTGAEAVRGGVAEVSRTVAASAGTADEAHVSTGSFSEIVSQNTWEIGDFSIIDTRRALVVCEHCRHGWTDTQRIAAYLSGHPSNPAVVVGGKELRAEWRATAPFNGIRSRQMGSMYQTIGLRKGFANYLQQFAEELLAAVRGGRETLMVHTNIKRAKVWEDPSEKADWKEIAKRAEDYCPKYEIPAQVVWINWAMDIQGDRVEILFVGWGDRNDVYGLEYHVEYGDFDSAEMQARVWAYLSERRFNHPVLGPLMWRSGVVDSRYQNPKVKAVFKFCADHWEMNVWSITGVDELAGSIYRMRPERRFGGRRVTLATGILKNMVFDRLKNQEPGENYIHFPKEKVSVERDGKVELVNTRFNDRFYMGVCSERKVRERLKSGAFAMRWKKFTSNTRNEPLDLLVYAFGDYEVMRPENFIARTWAEVQKKLAESKPAAEALPGTVNPAPEQKLPELRGAPQPRPRRRVRINSPFGGRFGRF